MGKILFGERRQETAERSRFAEGVEQSAETARKAQLDALGGFKPESRAVLEGRFGRADQAALAQGRTGLQDLQRDIQGAQAARGLGSTSIGTGQLVSGRKALTEREAQLKSSIQDRVNALRQQQRQAFFNAAGNIASQNQVPIRFEDQVNRGRTKGIFAPIFKSAAIGAGSFFGGLFGGKEGAKYGGKSGEALGGAADVTGDTGSVTGR